MYCKTLCVCVWGGGEVGGSERWCVEEVMTRSIDQSIVDTHNHIEKKREERWEVRKGEKGGGIWKLKGENTCK